MALIQTGSLDSFIPNKSLLKSVEFFFLLAVTTYPGVSFLVRIQKLYSSSWTLQELKTEIGSIKRNVTCSTELKLRQQLTLALANPTTWPKASP